MNFKQLEVFVSVVKNHSFSRAAEETFLSQPTVSSYIQALENECGTRLLIRSTKEVYPTRAGTEFFRYARALLQMQENARLSVKNCVINICGTLEIAASTVPAQYVLPAVLARMAARYPDLLYSLREYDSAEVVRRVVGMEAEIGLVGTCADDSHCTYEPLLHDQLVVITPNCEKFRNFIGNPLELLKEEPFLSREQGSGTRRELESALERGGLSVSCLRTRAQMDGTEIIKRSVAKGMGISVVSKLAAEDDVQAGRLLMFPLEAFFDRQFYFVYRKNWPLSPAAEAFMETARKMLGDLSVCGDNGG